MSMASSSAERSSSSRSTTPLMPGRIVIAYDATKVRKAQEVEDIITCIRKRGGMIQEVDTITVLGVLHRVLHPMGFQIQIGPDSFVGTNARAIKEEVSRNIDAYVSMLQHSAEECGGDRVTIEVKFIVGAPMKKVIVQEVAASNATWVVLDRYLGKELRFYLKHIPCKVALILHNLSLDVIRPHYSDKATGNIEHKLLYSLSKIVPLSSAQCNENEELSVVSSSRRESVSSQASSDTDKSSLASSFTFKSKEPSFFSSDEFTSNTQIDESDSNAEVKSNSLPVMQKHPSLKSSSDTKPGLDLAGCDYLEILVTKNGLSYDNLQGEGGNDKVEHAHDHSCPVVQKESNLLKGSDAPVLLPVHERKMGLDSMEYSYSAIQIATNDFSSENLLGKGGYGDVYKGELKGGQLISVKVQSEANSKAIAELHSEVYGLRFACHKNIVMILGFCCKENLSILVHEYICYKSLEWHLFDNTKYALEWHQRHAIAIGTAKGLRFLHEECRGSPIIHQDIRPSNILLTHDFVPLLGDCGLAKWKTYKGDIQTNILGTLGYLAPEYAENGICSVKTDVYAFGIVLIQLISGRKAVDSTREQSLRHWALPLIHQLKVDELVDPRIGDSYSTYELYQMARAAYLCIQTKPALRPTMGEVLRLLEGENDHLRYLTERFIPRLVNVQEPPLVEALLC